MTVKEIANTKKGQFAHIKWSRPCKTLKSCTDSIVKIVSAKNVRVGAEYDHLKTTIDGRADGTLPSNNQGLNGMEWLQYPTILKGIKNGKEYLRLETAKNSTFETKYFLNGIEVNKKDIEHNLLSSEKSNSEMPTVMNIGIDNILEIK